ncbi:MAG: hypothetical protein JWN72_1885 [Thermoleophilia bacterium]|nr:hypothetical protein [Thermoleophilia bacterium]
MLTVAAPKHDPYAFSTNVRFDPAGSGDDQYVQINQEDDASMGMHRRTLDISERHDPLLGRAEFRPIGTQYGEASRELLEAAHAVDALLKDATPDALASWGLVRNDAIAQTQFSGPESIDTAKRDIREGEYELSVAEKVDFNFNPTYNNGFHGVEATAPQEITTLLRLAQAAAAAARAATPSA